jgi:hypothetical protein
MAEQQTTAPELTVEQQIVALEQRIATFPPDLRRHWEEIIELERNRQRCRAIEEATRVTLPPDNRWGASAPPPTLNTTEPSAQRPSGWQPFDPISSPPGVAQCDILMDAQDRRDKAALLEAERLAYRQHIIDIFHEAQLADKERARAAAERTCHVGPGDPDWPSS